MRPERTTESGGGRAAPAGTEDEAFLRLTGLTPVVAASRRVGAAPETLRRHLTSGRCDGRKIGRRWYVNDSAVDRWVQGRPRRTAARSSAPCTADGRRCDDQSQTFPCSCSGPRLGDRAAGALTTRARRTGALALLREQERQLAIDVLGLGETVDLPGECRAWVDGVVEAVTRDASQAALDALLAALAGRLSAAPADVLTHLDRARFRDVVELS